MTQELVLFENSIRELSRLANRALALLAPIESRPDPVRYQEVLRCVSELHQLWADHLILQSHAVPMILSHDPHFTDFMTALDRDGADIEPHLRALSSAPWPRSAAAGLSSIYGRVTETLKALLRHVDRERTTVLPLLRRWSSREVSEPVETPVV